MAIMSGRRKSQQRRTSRLRRHVRVRKRVMGNAQRPRLTVYRSAAHIYCQVVDDVSGRTIVAASSRDKDLPAGDGAKVGAATRVGQLVAARAKAKGIDAVVFDRGGFKYHGRVAALADGAREGGLQF
jgi:large subunit ribosomal protein L18